MLDPIISDLPTESEFKALDATVEEDKKKIKKYEDGVAHEVMAALRKKNKPGDPSAEVGIDKELDSIKLKDLQTAIKMCG